jgi:uncharacterized protein (TIGR02996 family)
MSQEKALLNAYASSFGTGDDTDRLVLADWFEEQGDPSGRWLRDPEIAVLMGPSASSPFPALLEMLQSDSARARKLLLRMGRDAVPALVVAARVDSSPGHEQAEKLLRQIIKKEAAPPIPREHLFSDDPALQRAALDEIAARGEACVVALPELIELTLDARESVRIAAVEALARFGTLAVPSLYALSQCRNFDREATSALYRTIARFGPRPQVLEVLAEGFYIRHDDDLNVAEKALLTLGAAAVPVALNSHDNYQDGEAHAYHVAHFCHQIGQAAVPVLLEYVLKGDEMAPYALGQFTDPDSVELILPALLELIRGWRDRPQAACSSLWTLAELAQGNARGVVEQALPVVMEYLKESGGQGPALFALSKFGPAASVALPLVLPLANVEDYQVRTRAMEFISQHGGRKALAPVQTALASADPAARRRALETLSNVRTGSPELLATLLRAMSDPSVEVRSLAFILLFVGGWPDSTDLTEARRSALLDPDPGIRTNALQSTGWTEELAAQLSEELSSILTADPNVECRTAAAVVLRNAHVHAPGLLDALRAATRDPEPGVRRAALEALGRWDPLPADVPHLLLAGTEDPNDYTASLCLTRLSELMPQPPDEVVARVRTLLATRTQGLGCYCALALLRWASVPTAEDVPHLLEVMHIANFGSHEAGLVLVRMGAAAVPFLIDLLASDDSSDQQRAVFFLGEIGPESAAALPPLRLMLASSNSEQRSSAIRAVVRIAPEEAIDAVRASLRKRGADARRAALDAVAVLGPLAVPLLPGVLRLVPLVLDDYHRGILTEALAALADHSPLVVSGLCSFLDDPDLEVRNSAVDVLRRLGPRAALAVPELRRRFKGEPGLRSAITNALRAIDPSAVPRGR